MCLVLYFYIKYCTGHPNKHLRKAQEVLLKYRRTKMGRNNRCDGWTVQDILEMIWTGIAACHCHPVVRPIYITVLHEYLSQLFVNFVTCILDVWNHSRDIDSHSSFSIIYRLGEMCPLVHSVFHRHFHSVFTIQSIHLCLDVCFNY